MAYTMTALQKDAMPFINQIADVKNVGYGDVARFDARTEKVRAYIQAKASTTPRSYIDGKSIIVDTIEVSARPAVNLYELRSGRRNMAELISEAHIAINGKKAGHIMRILSAAVTQMGTPYYGAGSGIVQATFDELLLPMRRDGGAVILGDVALLDKLAPLAGFTPASATHYSGDTIYDFHMNGKIDAYKGAAVTSLVNPTVDGRLVYDPAFAYLMSVNTNVNDRNLKVVNEGGVQQIDATHIDNAVFEVRLDQLFGAAYVVGDTPTVRVYEDTSL